MLGVIADDLTGAAEIGAVGLRHGLRAEILLRPFNRPLPPPSKGAAKRQERAGTPDLLCLDTDSRFCSGTESARRAAAAARFLRKAGATLIYKKTDSILRGQVTPELQAIMRELHLELAILVPANPSLSRTIHNGHYFIHGQPIHKTDFARDPVHPRTSSLVTKLLHKPKRRPLFIRHHLDPLPSAGILVGNAATPSDLQHWAVRISSQILTAGGAEFFAAVLNSGADLRSAGSGLLRKPQGAPSCPLPLANDKTQLFICGSTSQSTRDFIATQGRLGTPLFSLPRQLANGSALTGSSARQIAAAATAALSSHSRIVLHVGLPLVRGPSLAKNLCSHLIRIAVLVLRNAAVSHIFVEGGATAVELVRSMRFHRLTVVQELAPGVATLVADSNLLLTVKPGSYRWPPCSGGS